MQRCRKDTHPGNLAVRPQAVSVADVDADGTPGRFIVLYCVRPTPETEGFLVIYQLDSEGIERVAVIQEGLGGHRASTFEGLKIDQLTGSDSPDLVLGLASGGSNGRRTVVIEDPFVGGLAQGPPKIHELPAWNQSEKGLNDTSAVFTGDFDGDGKPEVGYATTAWRGYDFRVYRQGADGQPPFQLLCAPVKVGSIGAAVATDLDGDGVCEVAVARHSYLSHDTRATGEWPEIADLSEGVFVYRFTRSAGGAGFERIYGDRLEDMVVDPPEFLRCEHLSAGRIAGRPALLASWFRWTEGRRFSFLDLHVVEKARGDPPPAKGGPTLRRHRIFWSDRDAKVVGYLADLNGDGDLEVVTLTGRLEPPEADPARTGAWQWRLGTWQREIPAFDGNSIAAEPVDPLVSALKSSIQLRHYRQALGLIKNDLQDAREPSPVVHLLWARAAGRARDWAEVDRAAEAAGKASRLEGRDRTELEMWKRAAQDGHALSKLTVMKEDFHSNPNPRWELSQGQAEWLEKEGAVCVAPLPPEPGPRSPARYLSRPCPAPINGDRGFFLGVDLCIENLGWNRILEIGLARVRVATDSPPSDFYGFRISQGGGMGAGWRWADLAWNDAPAGSPDRRFDLKEGSCYRFEVEHSPSERRVRMHVREIGGAASGEEFHRAWPPDEVTSWDDSAAQKAQPVAPGNYELGVFSGVVEGPGEGKEPVRIRIHSMELRVAVIAKN